jgi:hypothetical protein
MEKNMEQELQTETIKTEMASKCVAPDKYAKTVKQTAEYYLKELDKIAKVGEVPERYKKIFKGIKDPASHIRKVQRDIEAINQTTHKEHQKEGVEYNSYCEICKREKGEIVEEECVEEAIEDPVAQLKSPRKSEKATIVEEVEVETPVKEKKKKATEKSPRVVQSRTPLETLKKTEKPTIVEEPQDEEPEIVIRSKDGTTQKKSLEQLKEMLKDKTEKKQRTLFDLKK